MPNPTVPIGAYNTTIAGSRIVGPMPNPTGTFDAAAENPNIAQVAHDCIWEKSIVQDVVVA
jgi:hypothetical protein